MMLRIGSLLLVTVCCAPLTLAGRGRPEKLTRGNLQNFLLDFSHDITQSGAAFSELTGVKLPLLDEAGHPLGRRRITDRRQVLIDLEQTLKDFKSRPRDLVVTMTLSDQTEELADEVYDLSQIAYDNDMEDLAMKLTGLLDRLNNDSDLISAYALDLAAQKERELRALEKR
jgi:hypothetical protein